MKPSAVETADAPGRRWLSGLERAKLRGERRTGTQPAAQRRREADRTALDQLIVPSRDKGRRPLELWRRGRTDSRMVLASRRKRAGLERGERAMLLVVGRGRVTQAQGKGGGGVVGGGWCWEGSSRRRCLLGESTGLSLARLKTVTQHRDVGPGRSMRGERAVRERRAEGLRRADKGAAAHAAACRAAWPAASRSGTSLHRGRGDLRADMWACLLSHLSQGDDGRRWSAGLFCRSCGSRTGLLLATANRMTPCGQRQQAASSAAEPALSTPRLVAHFHPLL